MIKVLHTADLHVGWENYSRPTDQGLSSCLMAFRDTLDEITEIAVEEAVDLVVIAGDLYKMRDPSQTYQSIVAEFIAEISRDRGIPVVIVPGNHDLPGNPTKASTLDVFDVLEAKNVTILGGKPELSRIQTRSGHIVVAPLPWIRPADLQDADSLATAYQTIARQLANEAGSMMLVDTPIRPPAILVGHLTVANARPGSEAGMMLGKDPIIPVMELARPEFDAVMLGHIHNGQVFDDQYPVVAYCGSPQALDFSDEGDQKHVLIWQIEKGCTTFKDVPLITTRRFQTVNVEIDGLFTTPENAAWSTPNSPKGEIVRVNITVPKHLASQIDNNAIHEALKGAAWVQINKRVLQDNVPVRDVAALAGMSPMQALEKYCQDKTLTPGFDKAVLEAAAVLMKGE